MNVSSTSSCDLPPAKLPSSCSKTIPPGPSNELARLVQHYRDSDAYRGQEYDLYQWYGKKSLPLDAAIDRAFKSKDREGKIHGHQRRVGDENLKKLATIAKGHTKRFKNARTWNEVYEIVGDVIAQVRRAGVLAHYDIANRIGSRLQYEQTVLRVHAGAHKGAAALGLKIQNGTVALEDLPPELRDLGAMHTENFLCIYKDALKQLNRS